VPQERKLAVGRGRARLRGSGLFLLLAMLYCAATWSLDADLALQQINHRAYTPADGAPAPIYAITQTTDGTLWLAGSTGLVRFDGVHFVPYPGPSDEALPSTNISALIASPDGGLWIGFRLGGIGFLRNGHFRHYGLPEGLPASTVSGFAWDRDGALWVATIGGLLHLHGNRLERVAEDLIPTATGVFVDRAGTVWVATARGVLARTAGAAPFHQVTELNRGINGNSQSFAASSDGAVWVASRGFLTRLDSPTELRPHNREFHLPGAGRVLLMDSAGNLWIRGGSFDHTNIQLWTLRQQMEDMNSSQAVPHTQTFGQTEGLSGYPNAFFEDREHNIWVGTTNGLDRLSRSNVVRALPLCSGLGYAMTAGNSGGVLWAACGGVDQPTGNLTQISNGRIVTRINTEAFSAAYCDSSGTVWFGGSDSVAHLDGNRIVRTRKPEALRGFDVQALARDSSGGLWVSVVRKGVYRLYHGHWSPYGGLDSMPRGPAITETVDGGGSIWFGYPSNLIARLRAGIVRVFDATQGLNVGNVTAIHEFRRQLWVGGELGLARFDGTRFIPVLRAPEGALKGISGIAGSPDGALWLNALGGITHIRASEVEHAIHEPNYAVQSETFDYLDGVPGAAVQLRPLPSAVATSDGRVWFTVVGRLSGLIWVDPLHLVRNELPPPVKIWSISSGGLDYPNLGEALHLPVHTTRLQIDYAAGSLTIPERVHFRYRLEGSDQDWQDAGSRREAVYTNLSPGNYSFTVVASNNDGVWNNEGAKMSFTITPDFYQTNLFYTCCALIGLIALMVAYKLRVRQVAAGISARLEERLAERERIARELHDTLLQGVQGLIWRFQAATDRIPPSDKTRVLLEQSIVRADRLLAESRDRVKDLRGSTSTSKDIAAALAAEGEQLAEGGKVQFRASLEGATRELHPVVREETLLIAREALRNAFRHSGAQHVEADVLYGQTALRVRVRDDGCGIATDVLRSGKGRSHFGLVGMRERAQRIGADLVMWSKPETGTEVDLKVPGHLAYLTRNRLAGHLSWRRFIGGTGRNHARADSRGS